MDGSGGGLKIIIFMCQTKCCRNPKSLLAMGIVFVVLAGIFLIGAIIIKPII